MQCETRPWKISPFPGPKLILRCMSNLKKMVLFFLPFWTRLCVKMPLKREVIALIGSYCHFRLKDVIFILVQSVLDPHSRFLSCWSATQPAGIEANQWHRGGHIYGQTCRHRHMMVAVTFMWPWAVFLFFQMKSAIFGLDICTNKSKFRSNFFWGCNFVNNWHNPIYP